MQGAQVLTSIAGLVHVFDLDLTYNCGQFGYLVIPPRLVL